MFVDNTGFNDRIDTKIRAHTIKYGLSLYGGGGFNPDYYIYSEPPGRGMKDEAAEGQAAQLGPD